LAVPPISEGFPRREKGGKAGVTVTLKETEAPFQEAPSGTVWVADPEAVIGKVAVLAPAATVTLAGTVKAATPPDRVTVAPVDGAGAERVTVQVDVVPLGTLGGLHDKAVNCAEPDRVTEADSVTPFADAVTETD